MPKAPRDTESTTPKKRTRKATSDGGNGTHPEQGNGTQVAPVLASPENASVTVASPNVEEKIRVRAYEIYLQRGGNGGSPEQDWLRAVEEICGQQQSV